MFAELAGQSAFSFLTGCSAPSELVERADALGYSALALCDEASVAGNVRAFEAAKGRPLKLIHGARFHLDEGWWVFAWVLTADAWPSLCSTIAAARRRAPKGEYRIALHHLQDHPDLRWGYWPKADTPWQLALPKLLEHFGERLYLIAENRLLESSAHHLEALDAAAFEFDLKVVASSLPLMAKRADKPLQDLVTAIRLSTPLNELGAALEPNAERCLRPIEELGTAFPEAWLQETERLAAQVQFDLDQLKYRYPSELVPPSYKDASTYLAALVSQGAQERWPGGVPAKVRTLIDKELGLIAKLNYEPYFLTVHDVVAFARSQGILCQGRGSAANSVVCYCLFITEVDPARVDVLFERFISEERNEPPDIDVDFEHHRREEVIQYLYRRYGRERAALAATVITYRPKSAIKDVGRALGMDEGLLAKLSKSLSWWAKPDELEGYFNDQNLDINAERFQLFLTWVRRIQGLPRHLSQHVGGFVISDGPLNQWVPIENAAMPERTIVQWDKDDIETLGLLKLDVLALGMLSAIRRALDLAREWRETHPSYGGKIDPQFRLGDIPPEDPNAFQMLCMGDSIGVFQVESRAQMSMLPRMKPRTYYDLVIQVAIVRPGPIQGDMVHPYLRRRDGTEAVDYPSEAVKSVLQRTLGVPIFQEQVIQLAMVAAGFSGGEADQLRRAMAAWQRRGGLGHFEDKIKDGMAQRGYSPEFAERLFNQIQGFGKYGFPESHAASFALLVYDSAWLKCHVPEAFYCGLLNSYPMGFYSPSQLLQDARRHGVEVRPLDINRSGYDYGLEEHDERPAIRVGLRAIKKFKEADCHALLLARAQGDFTSLPDLAHRTGLSQSALEVLAGSGALDSLGGHRQQARWTLADTTWQLPLLDDASLLDEDTRRLPPAPEGRQVLEDYASLGFTLRTHPMGLLRERPEFSGCITGAELSEWPAETEVALAGLVTGRQRPGSAKGVMFATLEDETGNSNLIIWPKLVDRYRALVLTARLWRVYGEVQRQNGVTHLVVKSILNLDPLLGDLPVKNVSYRP